MTTLVCLDVDGALADFPSCALRWVNGHSPLSEVTLDPKERQRSLQTGHHANLRLLASCFGGECLEALLHVALSSDRIRGEWFALTDAVFAWVRRAQLANRLWESAA